MSARGPKDRGVDRWSWSDELIAARIEREQSIPLTACYAALCRIAGQSMTRDGFEVSMPALTRAMGAKDVKVARNSFWKLQDLGAIEVKERKIGRGQSLPHLVWLIEGAAFTAAEVGRETTGGQSPHGGPYVVSRQDRTSSRGRRSEEGRDQKPQREPPEPPLSRKPAPLGVVDLDLSKLQANGQHREEGPGDLITSDGEVPDVPKLDDALIRYGKAVGFKRDAKYVPEAVRDIRRRPSWKGSLLVPFSEIAPLVRTIAEIDQRKASAEERKQEAQEWDE